MHTVRIVVVGAGLSGLYAAYLLERQGITDYCECRRSPGKRDLFSALGCAHQNRTESWLRYH